MARCAPDFEPLLEQFDRRSLDDSPGAVFGLWDDYRLVYANRAWFRFAAENGGEPTISARWTLGCSIMNAVPEILRPHYFDLYAMSNIRAPRISGPVSREYECSSAEAYRRFMMQVYALDHGRGFLVVNSLLIERAHDPGTVLAPLVADYLDQNGLFCQCSHCRRYRCTRETGRWDWMPEWVKRQPAGSSHGLCQICFDYYYPKNRPKDGGGGASGESATAA
jgi:hypothetical protein